MERPSRIFISYRRQDTAYPAGWLYDKLGEHFAGGEIFKDVDSIELGDNFVQEITEAVARCDVLLALIGDKWLTIADENGRRRIDNPDDFVRLEIEAALKRDTRVIPILVDGAQMPRAEDLPPSLKDLVYRQALELEATRFDTDIERLVKVLAATLGEVKQERSGNGAARPVPVPTPPSPPPPPVPPRRAGPMWAIVLVALLAIVAVAVGASLLGGGGEDGDDGGGDGTATVTTVVPEPDSTTPQNVETRVVVAGTRPWTDTGVDVREGDTISVRATGTFYDDTVNNPNRSYNPEGVAPDPQVHPLDEYKYLRHGALIGRVREEGVPFFLGAGGAQVAVTSGRLYLAINDGIVIDNRGEYNVVLRVTRG